MAVEPAELDLCGPDPDLLDLDVLAVGGARLLEVVLGAETDLGTTLHPRAPDRQAHDLELTRVNHAKWNECCSYLFIQTEFEI